MSDQATEKRVTQTHIDAIEADSGPVYGVRLINELSIGGMVQAMPSRRDLKLVQDVNLRTVAGYEVLLGHYRDKCEEIERLKDGLRDLVSYTAVYGESAGERAAELLGCE